MREADWSREGRWRAAKSRPSGFRGLAILRTCGRAQDSQSTKRVLFGRRRELVTWPVLGRNYRKPSAANQNVCVTRVCHTKVTPRRNRRLPKASHDTVPDHADRRAERLRTPEHRHKCAATRVSSRYPPLRERQGVLGSRGSRVIRTKAEQPSGATCLAAFLGAIRIDIRRRLARVDGSTGAGRRRSH